MATFLMFGNYSKDALEGISSDRTKAAKEIIGDAHGSIIEIYATLGEHDLMLVVELPDSEAAMKASVGLSKATGIAFSTCPAVTVEKFDEMITGG